MRSGYYCGEKNGFERFDQGAGLADALLWRLQQEQEDVYKRQIRDYDRLPVLCKEYLADISKEIGVPIGIVSAVSYTHLDVYKRQYLYCIKKTAFAYKMRKQFGYIYP